MLMVQVVKTIRRYKNGVRLCYISGVDITCDFSCEFKEWLKASPKNSLI